MKRLLLILASVMMLAICCHEPAVDESQNQNPDYQAPTPPEEPNEDYDGLTRLTFEESDKNFPNPERGFYVPKDRFSSSLSKSDIQAARVQAMTLFYLGYYPTKYMSSDIPESFLNDIRADMQLLRDNGAKCIFRVAYKNNQNDMPSDPTPEWVARHIEQLKPVFQEYGDVIMVLQAGFIGTWGEWYYTDNFYFNPRTPEDHKLRKEVVDALLDAMPKDRSIGLRTPMFKRMMYADSYTDTLNLPDPKPTLHDNPMFSIRLANDGVWDDKTGYNMIYSTMHK